MNTKKKITSALDNFPAGKVLVVLVVIVVILQSYSAWKVIGLEGERVSLQRDIESFKEMQTEIPILQKQRDLLRTEVYNLDGKVKERKNRWSEISLKVADGEAIIEQSKKATSIRNELELAVRDLNQAIQAQTEEIKRMTGPTSKLSGSLDDLDSVVNKLEETPRKINITLEAVSSASENVRKSSQAMQSQVEDIQISLNKSIKDSNEAYKASLDASGKVSEAGASLIKATKLLNENADKFKRASKDVNKSTDNIKESAQRLETITGDIQQAGSKARRAIESFDSIKTDLLNVVSSFKNDNATAIKSMNRDIANIQKSSEKLSGIVEEIKRHATDFNDKISEIQSSKYDRSLSKHSDDIMEAAKTAGEIETQLKKLIDRIQSLADKSIGDFEALRQELDSAKKRISKIKDPVNNEN